MILIAVLTVGIDSKAVYIAAPVVRGKLLHVRAGQGSERWSPGSSGQRCDSRKCRLMDIIGSSTYYPSLTHLYATMPMESMEKGCTIGMFSTTTVSNYTCRSRSGIVW